MTAHEFNQIIKASSKGEQQVYNLLRSRCGIDRNTVERYLSGEQHISESMSIMIKRALNYA